LPFEGIDPHNKNAYLIAYTESFARSSPNELSSAHVHVVHQARIVRDNVIKIARMLQRPDDLYRGRVSKFGVIFFGSFFVEVGLFSCISCNPVPRRTRNHPHEAL